jgi:hypothetical protein
MKFSKILMTLGVVVILSGCAYSIGNIYYFGPKGYDKLCKKPGVTQEEIDDYAAGIYPRSLPGAQAAAGGLALYLFGLGMNQKKGGKSR